MNGALTLFAQDAQSKLLIYTDADIQRAEADNITDLARAFLAEDGPPPPVEGRVLERLRNFPWPGNVRQLKHVLLRLRLEHPHGFDAEAISRALGERCTSVLFPPHLLAEQSLPALKERLERGYILFHLRRLGGDSSVLRRQLGLSRKQLYRRCLRHGISLREELKKARGPRS